MSTAILFACVALAMLSVSQGTISTLQEALVAGRWKKIAELDRMSQDDKRNTLIVEMIKNSNLDISELQAKTDLQLIGMAAICIFLRDNKFRTLAGLRLMSDHDQRNSLIVELHNGLDKTVTWLQSQDDLSLVDLGNVWAGKAALKEDTPGSGHEGTGSRAIELKYVTDYDWVYNDRGTGANSDVSIWRPKSSGYCALGDVAHGGSHSKPTCSAMMVKARTSGAVAHPTGFTEIWNDGGSGGKYDVRILRMNAPAGYTCLGYVAVVGYNRIPNRSDYCCVREKYVTPGNLMQVWTDAGSGARRDVSFWKITTISGGLGLDDGTFLAVANHGYPGENAYQLDKSKAAGQEETAGSRHEGTVNVENLAQTYAPRVWLATNEAYYPSSVDYHFANTKLEGLSYPPTVSNMPNNGRLVTKKSLSKASGTLAFFAGQRNLKDVPVYALVADRSCGFTDIVYWMFYPYNRGKRACIGAKVWGHCVGGYSTFGHHVGDWEHLTVRLHNGRLHSVFIEAHGSDGASTGWYKYDGGQNGFISNGRKIAIVSNTHPVVYEAWGSHGLYHTPGEHVYKRLFNGVKLADLASQGTAWDTWNKVKAVAYKSEGGYTGNWAWLNFRGRFGNNKMKCVAVIGQCILESGPTAINFRSSMTNGDK